MRLLLCIAALGLALPRGAAAQDPAAEAPPIDLLTAGPFHWLEVARHDERPRSPITERTTVVTLPAPVSSGARHSFTLLGTYRRDLLRPDAMQQVGATERTLHVIELGAPLTLVVAPEWAFEIDARVAYATAFAGNARDAWVPGIRSGVTWAGTRHPLALSLSVLYSPTVLDGVAPVPLLGLYYRPTDRRVRIDMLLPRYAEVAGLFRGGPLEGEVYGAFHWEGVAWAAPDGVGQDRLNRQEVRIDAGVRVRLLGPLGLELGTHWVPRQTLTLGDRTYRRRMQDDFSITAALVFDKVAGGALGPQ
ncbi:MAG: hypothetical protein AAGH15_22015 [Myxococcota bacterium]